MGGSYYFFSDLIFSELSFFIKLLRLFLSIHIFTYRIRKKGVFTCIIGLLVYADP